MISGDIDLTENLDFRKDKPDQYDTKKYEIVPWQEDHNTASINLNTGSNFTNYISSTTPTYTWYHNENSGWDDLIYNITPVSNDDELSATFSLRVTVNPDNTITTYTNNYNYWYEYDPVIQINAGKSEDIFGYHHRLKKEDDTVPICQRCGQLGHKYCCEDDDNDYTARFALKGRPRHIINSDCFVPWDDKKERKRFSYGKEQRPIPWLRNLLNRIYDDYIRDLFEEDHDYTSYLTNYGWLQLH